MEDSIFKQDIVIKDRKLLTINGVKNIIEFTDTFLLIEGVGGKICVEGRELTVENLSKDTGELWVNGQIDAVFYKGNSGEGGWLARMFK